MKNFSGIFGHDRLLFLAICTLSILSTVVLRAIAPQIFPQYFLYLALGLFGYILSAQIDFDIWALFSKHSYIFSVVFLLLPLILGQVTRGAIRWLNLGPLTIQPAEIVRPFLLIFFANFLAGKDLNFKKIATASILFALPFFLIAFQPSLGVAVLTGVGFLGILIASNLPKKFFLFGALILVVCIPLFWSILAPYQKARIVSFLEPGRDPAGSGYNSLQAIISVGSGKLFGRGLGKGTETQLQFLPEKQTDFVFAAFAEELGFVGALILVLAEFLILWRLSGFMTRASSPQARALLSGLFAVYLGQVFVHLGMNLGILPITGVPLPLVSAGGSSYLATMISLGIAQRCVKL